MLSTIMPILATQSIIALRRGFDIDNVYFFVSRSTAWDNESDPPAPDINVTDENALRASMLCLYKVAKSDTFMVFPRSTWTINTVYTQYSADSDVGASFVINSSNNVYKCISNNSGAQSLYSPVGTSTNIILLADGYQWKFMYNISEAVSSKFLDSNYVPVPYEDADKTDFQKLVEQSASFSTGTPPGGHGYSAAGEIKASAIMIRKTVNGDSNLMLPSHRQFGLIVNPLLSDGTAATADLYDLSDSNPADINIQSGFILGYANHVLVEPDGTGETFKLVVDL